VFLRGRVEKVIYRSGPFHILSFRVYEPDDVKPKRTKVSGDFFGVTALIPGAILEVGGAWGNHQKYGKQFKVKNWTPWCRNAVDAQFFLGNCVRVFDSWPLLRRTVRDLGDGIYEALKSEQILEAAEDEEERAALAIASSRWRTIRGMAVFSEFLQKHGFNSLLIAQIFRCFGPDAVEIISDDPYRLMEIEEFPFRRAEALGVARGIGPEDPRRIRGAVLWVVRDQIHQGHLFVRRGEISKLMETLAFRNNVPAFGDNLGEESSKAVGEMEREGVLKVDAATGVYTSETYLYERGSAQMLSRFLVSSELVIDLDIFLQNYEAANSITLSDMQREAIERLIANRVLVVTGAPGTGKTTLIRAFVHLFRQLKISHMLMAPTGIAAKRLSAVTGTEAKTVHRALRYDGHNWGHDSNEPLETEAVIVDETSMVDQALFYRLLDALEPQTMLVLVGDDAQLPSVGAGNVLRELLACKALSRVRLEHIFRQAETSDIVLAAHQIRNGQSPLGLPKKENTEFQFVSASDESMMVGFIVEMAAKLKGRDANFQVLSPKYEGTVGVDNLNAKLRDKLNPKTGQPSWKLPEFETRIGDRLMVIRNDYKLNIYNGDIGKLVSIKKDSLTLRIHGVGDSPDANVDIPKEEAGFMLKLAYAVTVHRCQGEEFETVILPLVKAQGVMLQRNLFYTAITRARKKVWLLGDADAVLKAVANDKVIQRNTILRDLITSERIRCSKGDAQ